MAGSKVTTEQSPELLCCLKNQTFHPVKGSGFIQGTTSAPSGPWENFPLGNSVSGSQFSVFSFLVESCAKGTPLAKVNETIISVAE